jgi:GT2 family glycosyltransferase
VLASTDPLLLDEIIVVDNASGDKNLADCMGLSPIVRLERLPKNLGYGGGANAGARLARGDSLVLMNNDTEVAAGWLSCIQSELLRFPAGAVVSPLITAVELPDTIQAAGTYLSPLGTTGAFLKGLPVDRAADFRDIPCPTGACMAIPRELFLSMGGFDETFFMYCEDVDFGLRARGRGIPIILASGVRIAHRTGGHRPESQLYYQFTFRNRMLAIRKNMGGWAKIQLLLFSFCFAIASLILLRIARKLDLRGASRALVDGLSLPLGRNIETDGRRGGGVLGWSQTFRHLLGQARAHIHE